ncbi:MAG: hypothetical protein KatS3mg115_2414 [Candidatus Poribacteria bacterium]|nr:MAG: hypothetical protein KatS3mg115_2414 [Candidatus Poribacteria bacterium]
MDPNYKVTIIPRGRALGLTVSLPMDERHNHTREELLARISYALGGRIAEELVFNEATTGAKNDFEQATDLARRMVCEFGMSEKLGPVAYGRREEQIFLGRELATHRDYSEQTAQMIDAEVRNIIDTAWATAMDIIQNHMTELRRLADALLERETLDSQEIEELIGPKVTRQDRARPSGPSPSPAQEKPASAPLKKEGREAAAQAATSDEELDETGRVPPRRHKLESALSDGSHRTPALSRSGSLLHWSDAPDGRPKRDPRLLFGRRLAPGP